MTNHIKQLLVFLVLTAAAGWPPPARAQGGVVVRPYWSFRTEAPVRQVHSGDIDGDGVPEIVILTANDTVYVLDNDGNITWQHEAGLMAHNLLVADLDGDSRSAEIFVGGRGEGVLLTDSQKPAWYWRRVAVATTAVSRAADLNGDGRPEIIVGGNTIVAIDPASGGHYPTDWPSSETQGAVSRPVRDLWVGDLDGDDLPELLPSVIGDDSLYALQDTDLDLIWQQSIDAEVGLVQAGDVDGDGLAEIAVLTTDWQLILLDNRVDVRWRQSLAQAGHALPEPAPGQFLARDLDGDRQAEILALLPASTPTLAVLDGRGNPLWEHQFRSSTVAVWQNTTLLAADLTYDGQAEIMVAPLGAEQLYFLTGAGQPLAEYHSRGPITAVDYADLNSNGRGEIIVGTEVGVQVFGTSADVVWQERWQSPSLGVTRVNALTQVDLNNDGRHETVVGLQSGWLFVVADNGRILWDVDLGGAVQTVAAGDVTGDGRPEIVAGTTREGGQLLLLRDGQPDWVQRINAANEVLLADVAGEGRPGLFVRSGTTRGLVQRLDEAGQTVWRQRFDEPVTALGVDSGDLLVGTAGGLVHRLAPDGMLLAEASLETEIVGLIGEWAVTSAGQIFRLDGESPSLIQEVAGSPLQFLRSGAQSVILAEGQVSLMTDDGVATPVVVEGRATALAVGGGDVIVVGTDSGRVHLFGLTLDQPPLLTRPNLSETRDGYVYSVKINDPDREPVQVTLEVWDPSAGDWLAYDAQTVREAGLVSWAELAPFDTWDSGRESRFRFSYDDGRTARTTAEIPGPLTIPTPPWTVFYGQRLALGAAALLAALLGWGFYRRRQSYRHSPAGRAESALRHLQAAPQQAMLTLQRIARTEPELLVHLPGLAIRAGESTLANLSESFHLMLARPEVMMTALRTAVATLEQLPPDEEQVRLAHFYRLYLQMLEANTVSKIVALQPQLPGLEPTLPDSDPLLAAAAPVFAELTQQVEALDNYQRVETVTDKAAYLAQVIEGLGRLEQRFNPDLPQLERNLFSRVAMNWLGVATHALQDLQGRAELEAVLKTRQLLKLEQATLSLEVTNRGRSPASNIIVSLAPDQPYAVNNGRVQLDLLPAGRSVVLELPIACAESVDQFRAEFLITYDDREREGKSLALADIVHLLRPAAEFKPLPNPYAPGTPLAPASPTFFGREDLFQFIRENIAGLTRQNILVLIGQRRMGKTSFLQQLLIRLSDAYLPVYVDGQSLGIDAGMANFFYDLSLAITDALNDAGIMIDEPAPVDFQERPSGHFEREFLTRVFAAIGERRLLLLFDEFEELEMRVDSGKLDPALFSFLRHLMQHDRRLGFIFVGAHRLESLSSDYWSIFFNIALYKHVTFLDEAAARALIVEPVADYGLMYDDLALDKMLRATAGHPYILQLTCHALVNRANRERRSYVTIQDVNVVLSDMVELGEAHFAFLWDQSSNEAQLVQVALTWLLHQAPTVAPAQIAALLRERGLGWSEHRVNQVLQQLVERDIIRETGDQPPRYEYKVELIRLWLERYKTLGRVVEEIS
jgi:hypothetical protein